MEIVEIELDLRAGEQRFRQVRLKGEGSRRPLPRAGQMSVETLPSRFARKLTVPHVRLGETRPREREGGVQLHRALISGQGFARALLRVAIGIKPALQIILVGLHIFRPAFFRRLHLRLNRRLRRRICGAIRELTAQLCYDGLSEFGLHGKHVLQITSKVFRPELLARVGAGEPGRDPHAVAGLAHASLDQMRHTKFLPDLLGRRVLAFERKCRRPRGHVQPGNFL